MLSALSVGILSITLEYNLSQWQKTSTFTGPSMTGHNCPKGLHCSPFSLITAAAFPLNTGPMKIKNICISSICQQLSTNRVQVEKSFYPFNNPFVQACNLLVNGKWQMLLKIKTNFYFPIILLCHTAMWYLSYITVNQPRCSLMGLLYFLLSILFCSSCHMFVCVSKDICSWVCGFVCFSVRAYVGGRGVCW